MAEIRVRLFGFGKKAGRFQEEAMTIPEGATVRALWEGLKARAKRDELLAGIDERAVLVLINGKPIHHVDDWQTVLADGDRVSLMVKAFGG